MSALIRNRQIEADDYATLADDEALPASGAVIVSLARWQAEQAALETSGLAVGVRIPNTADIATLWPSLASRPLIALEFPAFGDGRAYSQARVLRDRYGFTDEIRATGAAVVRDQIHNMHRSGINSFALRVDQDPAQCLAAFNDFDLAYQPGAEHVTPIVRRLRL